MLRRMRRVFGLVAPIFLAACGSLSTPGPGAPEPTACPSIATANAFITATLNFDGASGAALFTPDGFVQFLVLPPNSDIRLAGTDRITGAIKAPNWREVQITRPPQGCGSQVTWGARSLPVNPGSAQDWNVTATLRDGKIASVVYTNAAR